MGKIMGRFILPHPPILVPEVGGEEARLGQKTLTAFATIGQEIARLQPDTIIITSPHAPCFNHCFYINENSRCSGDLAQFGNKKILLGFDTDLDLIELIKKRASVKSLKSGSVPLSMLKRYGFTYDLDHGIIVPLYFINHFYSNYKLIPLGLTARGPQEHYLMGEAIAEAIAESDKKVVVIASGDMSHKLKEDGPYGFDPQGPIFEAMIENLLQKGDIYGILNLDPALEEQAAQCGLYSIQILCGTLSGYTMKAEVLSHEGPFGVGYLIARVEQGEPAEENYLAKYLQQRQQDLSALIHQEAPALALARMALAHYLDCGKELPIPSNLPREFLTESGGAFVCFKKAGDLRGCIGTLTATQPNLAAEIVNNAIAAGTKDLRFSPITPGEINSLQVSVDIIGPLEEIEGVEDLNPQQYGVVVSCNGKRGVLLPNLEGVNTAEEQIKIAREKAGIPFYKKIKLQRFEVMRYE